MRVVLIVQARMGSTRLPGKVLKSLLGKPMLARQIERLRIAKKIDAIVVATSDTSSDDPVAQLGKNIGVDVFRGSENDVLDRYYWAAKAARADIVVRVTGDCPMHSASVVDTVVEYFFNVTPDYASNVTDSPEGQDTEVFTFAALERAWREARLPSEREHVTLYIRNHPELFRLEALRRPLGTLHPALHLSVDTPEDFAFAEAVFKNLGDYFEVEEIITLLERFPDIRTINKGGTGYEGLAKSLKEDEIEKFVKSLRIAVVGCGSIGARHARNLHILGVGELLLCDPNLSRAQELAREVGGKAYDDYRALLDTQPNAIVIATPSSLHVEQAFKAVEKSIPIFIEKPLATSLEGLDTLVHMVTQKNIITMVGQSYRWHEGLLALKKKLDDGDVGAVARVMYRLGQYLPQWHPTEDYRKEYAAQKQLGGGAMFTSMSHTLDTIEWLFGSIQEYGGKKERLGDLEIDVDDTATIRAVTECGVVVDAVNDFLAEPAIHTIEIKGTKGSVVADLIAHTIDGVAYSFEPNHRYVEEMRYFLELLRTKTTDSSLTVAHGAHIVALMTDPRVTDETVK
jgi:spore coat polysaccharide biosynthesis protein SpsF